MQVSTACLNHSPSHRILVPSASRRAIFVTKLAGEALEVSAPLLPGPCSAACFFARETDVMTMKNLGPGLVAVFWRFVRGDMDAEAFEDVLHASDKIASEMGSEDHLHAISVDFRDARQVQYLREYLRGRLPSPADCKCHAIPNRGSVHLGQWPSSAFDTIEREVEGLWWFDRMRCRACGTVWWVAREERIYDVWIVSRDKTEAQLHIGTYRALLEAARASGAFVRYADPYEAVSIPAVIEELALERPGIACSEIVKLLPVEPEVVKWHARRVASLTEVDIGLEA
jgi:hypothetical protein